MRSLKLMKNQRGASVIEFAVILPLLLVVLFGIIEFSILLYNKAVLTNASREGARFGIVSAAPRKSEAEISGTVLAYCNNNLITFTNTKPDPNINLTGWNATATMGTNLGVQVDYDYTFLLIPGFIPGLPQPLTLSARTVMKYE